MLIGVALLLTTVDPIQVTEYSLVFSAVVLPLTYLPILVVANDREYLGDRVNGPVANALGLVYLVADVGSEIRLRVPAGELAEPPLETWLREHLIDRIPGAGNAGE